MVLLLLLPTLINVTIGVLLVIIGEFLPNCDEVTVVVAVSQIELMEVVENQSWPFPSSVYNPEIVLVAIF